MEDEAVLAELLERKLQGAGYDVTLTGDGEEGMASLRAQKPDLILLDIIMPKKGGIEVLEEINKDPDLMKIPVIVISNSGQPVEIDRIMKLNVRDYLVKTNFEIQEIIDKVIQQIGR